MKKNILLILGIILLSGCSAKYELEIRDNNVIEKTSFIMDKSEVIDDSIYYSVDNMVGKYFPSADFLIGDTQEFYDGDDAIYQKVSKYTLKKYKTSDLINFAYQAYNVLTEDDYILLTTSDVATCFDRYDELDSLDIIIKSNHKLIETNADEVGKYTYTWHITKDNYANKSISLKLYQDKYVFNYNNEFIRNVGIIGGIIVIVSIFILIFVKKKKKSNKF